MDEARRNKPIIADREIVVLAGLKPFARGLHPPQAASACKPPSMRFTG